MPTENASGRSSSGVSSASAIEARVFLCHIWFPSGAGASGGHMMPLMHVVETYESTCVGNGFSVSVHSPGIAVVGSTVVRSGTISAWTSTACLIIQGDLYEI